MSRLGGSPPSMFVNVPPLTGSFFGAPCARGAVVARLDELELEELPDELSSLLPPPHAAMKSPVALPTTVVPNSRRRLIAARFLLMCLRSPPGCRVPLTRAALTARVQPGCQHLCRHSTPP